MVGSERVVNSQFHLDPFLLAMKLRFWRFMPDVFGESSEAAAWEPLSILLEERPIAAGVGRAPVVVLGIPMAAMEVWLLTLLLRSMGVGLVAPEFTTSSWP